MSYRISESGAHNDRIRLQMESACNLLIDWRKMHPCIAGGALWSWAANLPANDLDIWVKDSWRARRKAKEFVLDNNSIELAKKIMKTVHNYFGSLKKEGTKLIKSIRYKGRTKECNTSIDLILSKGKGIAVVNFFDYQHCAVGFSIKEITTLGSESYKDGNLVKQQSSHGRTEEAVMAKVQMALWGHKSALDNLNRVMMDLKEIYEERKRNATALGH